MPGIRRRKKLKIEYDYKIFHFEEKNLDDIKEKIKDIKVYQGTVEEVSKELGRPLKRIETNAPETFIKANDTFWLRVKAYLLGANAIIHYQPGSSIGTPVKYQTVEGGVEQTH